MEEWKYVQGYEGRYQVSNIGRLKSLFRDDQMKNGKRITVEEKILKPKIIFGYEKVNLLKSSNRKTFSIHQLVARAFIPNPINYKAINHLNGDKRDNAFFNLQWCNDLINNRHAYATGLNHGPVGEFSGHAKLTNASVIEIRKLSETMMLKDIAEIFQVAPCTISQIVGRKLWKHI